MIKVQAYDVECAFQERSCRRTPYRIRIELVADDDGLVAFLSAMERAGFAVPRRTSQPERRLKGDRELPTTAESLALPAPIEGEFLDEEKGS